MSKRDKVLIVDDEPLIVEELTEFFTDSGVDCVGCTCPTAAIRLFHEDDRIGVVLSDYRMPGLNGVELIKLLSQTRSSSRILESILFTSDADKEDVIKALRAGVSDYYQKPLDLDALLVGVRRLQDRVRQRSSAASVETIGERIQEMVDSLQQLQHSVSELSSAETANPVPIVELPGYSKLSPRQVEVAELLAKGLTNYQISCELGISENTVKLYVSQVLRATNMHNRTLLALALGGRR